MNYQLNIYQMFSPGSCWALLLVNITAVVCEHEIRLAGEPALSTTRVPTQNNKHTHTPTDMLTWHITLCSKTVNPGDMKVTLAWTSYLFSLNLGLINPKITDIPILNVCEQISVSEDWCSSTMDWSFLQFCRAQLYTYNTSQWDCAHLLKLKNKHIPLSLWLILSHLPSG